MNFWKNIQGVEHRVRLWLRKTQKQRAEVFGTVPKISGASDHL